MNFSFPFFRRHPERSLVVILDTICCTWPGLMIQGCGRRYLDSCFIFVGCISGWDNPPYPLPIRLMFKPLSLTLFYPQEWLNNNKISNLGLREMRTSAHSSTWRTIRSYVDALWGSITMYTSTSFRDTAKHRFIRYFIDATTVCPYFGQKRLIELVERKTWKSCQVEKYLH